MVPWPRIIANATKGMGYVFLPMGRVRIKDKAIGQMRKENMIPPSITMTSKTHDVPWSLEGS